MEAMDLSPVAVAVPWRTPEALIDPTLELPCTHQRQAERLTWELTDASPLQDTVMLENVHLEARHARASGRGVGAMLDETLEILRQQEARRAKAEADRRTAEEQEAMRKAAEQREKERAEAARLAAEAEKAEREKSEQARIAEELRNAAQAHEAAQAAAASAAVAAAAPLLPATSAASTAGAAAAPAASIANPAAPIISNTAPTDVPKLEAEWEASRASAQRDDALAQVHAKAAIRSIKMLISQVARVHSVVWERGDMVSDVLSKLTTDDERRAACAAVAKKVLNLGEMMVDKQPGMAYALSGFLLHVGEHHPLVWECLNVQMQAACCYCVPCHVKRPPSGSNDEHKALLGYRKKGDGKTWEDKKDFYTRVAGQVALYSALLQQAQVSHFTPPSEALTMRPVANPLGMPTAWAWLARMVNQPPAGVTATTLLAFLKPSAHALLAAYPRQFPKLLRFLSTTYSAKIHAKFDGAEKPPEEQAAIMTLDAWVKDTLKLLGSGRSQRQMCEALLPKEAVDMPAFKPPDDTSGGGNDFD
mmetsp:Transcript_45603/g.119779  ORF Transcript_45603/g.119779 Transcript_45603/m.119779 type:complete len:534 (-) Transcript_45603:255-1856(-)